MKRKSRWHHYNNTIITIRGAYNNCNDACVVCVYSCENLRSDRSAWPARHIFWIIVDIIARNHNQLMGRIVDFHDDTIRGVSRAVFL